MSHSVCGRWELEVAYVGQFSCFLLRVGEMEMHLFDWSLDDDPCPCIPYAALGRRKEERVSMQLRCAGVCVRVTWRTKTFFEKDGSISMALATLVKAPNPTTMSWPGNSFALLTKNCSAALEGFFRCSWAFRIAIISASGMTPIPSVPFIRAHVLVRRDFRYVRREREKRDSEPVCQTSRWVPIGNPAPAITGGLFGLSP